MLVSLTPISTEIKWENSLMAHTIGTTFLCLVLLLAGSGPVTNCAADCCSVGPRLNSDTSLVQQSALCAMNGMGTRPSAMECDCSGCGEGRNHSTCTFCGCSHQVAYPEHATTFENPVNKVFKAFHLNAPVVVRAYWPVFSSEISRLKGHSGDISIQPTLPVYLSNHSFLC